MKTNRFEKKIAKLFRHYEIEQYRESRGFVEFWLMSKDQPATTDVTLADLKKLSKILGSKEMTVTGGTAENEEITRVLITTTSIG